MKILESNISPNSLILAQAHQAVNSLPIIEFKIPDAEFSIKAQLEEKDMMLFSDIMDKILEALPKI